MFGTYVAIIGQLQLTRHTDFYLLTYKINTMKTEMRARSKRSKGERTMLCAARYTSNGRNRALAHFAFSEFKRRHFRMRKLTMSPSNGPSGFSLRGVTNYTAKKGNALYRNKYVTYLEPLDQKFIGFRAHIFHLCMKNPFCKL